jgi:hypothetical protein
VITAAVRRLAAARDAADAVKVGSAQRGARLSGRARARPSPGAARANSASRETSSMTAAAT